VVIIVIIGVRVKVGVRVLFDEYMYYEVGFVWEWHVDRCLLVRNGY